ncbi:hypothetical protein Desde_3088 [Desulfitobacterium dehalogenans ATCC 51507]|uniref:Lipoprotein n=1 Tax=Desulfitobacterium dehalogenans (strain ATCC 51507 / DSM 9161 / JW/IU-DC1) TaxID=756499 RepID=I4ABP7_DESDJ|nr:DUF6612 family protein [Desulfitobacterium dehalogenans]AFM01382.1 hypothetical protein Desde_3088 [Desulfitobacterium dehalogenans ATCC 51507]
MNKKISSLILILMCTLVLAACSTGTTNLSQGKSPEQIVEESFAKWYGLKSYDMDMVMTMKFSVGEEVLDMSMTGKGAVFQNPIKMKMVMEANIPGMDQKMTLEQYVVQNKQKMAIYQNIENNWQKIIFDDPAMTEKMYMDPKDNLKLFMDHLVSAEILGEEKIGEKDTLKIKLVASGDIFDQIFQETAGNTLGVGNGLINPDVFSQIGDMVYTIWVDKVTLDTLKCQMDLSENMRNLGKALAEDPKLPLEIKDIFSDAEIFMEYTILNQNSAQDFTIPEEAMNAPEVELPTA